MVAGEMDVSTDQYSADWHLCTNWNLFVISGTSVFNPDISALPGTLKIMRNICVLTGTSVERVFSNRNLLLTVVLCVCKVGTPF